jgi:transposase
MKMHGMVNIQWPKMDKSEWAITMLAVFSMLSRIDVSYKAVERLRSDDDIIM